MVLASSALGILALRERREELGSQVVGVKRREGGCLERPGPKLPGGGGLTGNGGRLNS